MKKFLTLLVLLGLAGGGIYYYDPSLMGLDTLVKRISMKDAGAGSASAENALVAVEESGAGAQVAHLAFPDNHDARALAKAEGRPALILWYGSDWLPNAAQIEEEWKELEKKKLPVVLGQINEVVGSVPDLHDREKLLPIGAFSNLPVAVLLAPDETLLAIYDGKTVLSAAAMEKAVELTLKQMPQYMQLVEKARKSDGIEGAKAAADALAMMPYEDAMRNRELKDILNSKDPKHETLFRYLYCMDHMGMYDEINAVLCGGKGADAQFQGNDRKFDEGIKFVEKVMKARLLNKELEQQWTSGLAYVYREKYNATKEPALRKLLVDTYRKVVEIDSESEYGKGALRWANYWDDSIPYIFNELFYDSGEMTVGFEKEWRVNVSKFMDGPGSYTFSLVPCPSKNGKMTSKGFQLFANDKLVCEADVPADKDTKTVNFEVPRALKGHVEVRFKVQCFDGWFGCAGEMTMKKN